MPQVSLDELSQADCICPICLEIFLEPVTLPCDHTFCKPCFQQTVDKSNLCCPLCRKRVSTWARLHARNKTLVNEEMWERVQKAFPVHCQRRLSGQDQDDPILNALIPQPQLCKPGELRREYEDQKSKLEAEKRVLEEEERRASEEYIQQLAEDEERRAEESRRAVQLQLENDARLAQMLVEELNTNQFSETHGPSTEISRQNSSGKKKKKTTSLGNIEKSSHSNCRTGDEDTSNGTYPSESDSESNFKSKRLKVLSGEGDPPEGEEFSVDASCVQQLKELENDFFSKLQQEKTDRLLALQLQRQLNKEMKEVNRKKNSPDGYLLRIKLPKERASCSKERNWSRSCSTVRGEVETTLPANRPSGSMLTTTPIPIEEAGSQKGVSSSSGSSAEQQIYGKQMTITKVFQNHVK
ncbi:RN168 ligase, partial [Polyodon spathula]|nr:RN168 ligase [Polyodon spathula]